MVRVARHSPSPSPIIPDFRVQKAVFEGVVDAVNVFSLRRKRVRENQSMGYHKVWRIMRKSIFTIDEDSNKYFAVLLKLYTFSSRSLMRLYYLQYYDRDEL